MCPYWNHFCLLCICQFYGASRALLETLTRFKFLEQQLDNVVLRSKSLVTGLSFNQDKTAVTGEGYYQMVAGVTGAAVAIKQMLIVQTCRKSKPEVNAGLSHMPIL
jgi:hypothetical protein